LRPAREAGGSVGQADRGRGSGLAAGEAAEQPVDELLRNLDLEPLDADLFLGDPGRGQGRLFGGMVAAQAVIAAGRSVDPDRRLHSLHGYFLRPGRHDVPLRFVVRRIRDGRTFTTRHVTAHQAGEAIFDLSASFTLAEQGLAHQDPMPEAPGPEGLPDWEEERARVLGDPSARRLDTPIEVRLADGPLSEDKRPARQRNWMRVRGRLPDDPLVHTAMLVYATDRTLLGTGARPHGLPWGKRMSASLDHAVWIHHQPILDGWLLYTSESPIAQDGRAMIFGAIYTPDGTRIASVAQEGLIRLAR
jgi:acyl-CoA thioesterase-2